MLRRGPGGRIVGAAGVVLLAALAACSGGSSNDTLSPIGGTTGPAPVLTTASAAGPAGTTLDPASAGSGYVQLTVQSVSSGINETLGLDRATVRRDALDPVTLNATCTPLDGGDVAQGIDVTVVDLRRLSGGNRLISAVLHVDGAEVEDGDDGEHAATLQLGEADQTTTSYTGSVLLEAGGYAGTLDLQDPSGRPLTGAFVCADVPPPTTAVVPDTGGDNEAVPGTPAPTTPTTPTTATS